MNIKKMLESENFCVSKKREMDVLRKIVAEIQSCPSDLYLKSLFSTQLVEYIEIQIRNDCSCNIAEDLSFVETQKHQLVDEGNKTVQRIKNEAEDRYNNLNNEYNKATQEIIQLKRDKENLNKVYMEYSDKYFAIQDDATRYKTMQSVYEKLQKKFETMKNIFEM